MSESKLWAFLSGVSPRLVIGCLLTGALALGAGSCSSSTSGARTCTEVECGRYGSCFELDAGAMCVCDEGYTGDDCTECANGYEKNGSRCVPSGGQTGMMSCDDDPCGANGSCDDSDGEVVCECDEGYTGDDCSECDDGYHADPEDDAVCVVDEACGGDSCPANASCDDTGGIITCTCNEGWDGAQCGQCAAGYHDEGGDCVEDTECGANTCPNGTCDDSSGVPVCTCDPGYAGEYCDECAEGYHEDGDACVEDQTCGPDSCPANATCDDTGGVITCECNEGYTGDDCDECVAPLVLEDGECVEASGTECDPGLAPNDAGVCSLACDEGTTLVDIAGVNPLTLPVPDGYELVPPDTIVFPDGGSITVESAGTLVCLPLGYTCDQYDPCGGSLTRGYCEDQSGLPLCICNDGYAGLLCDQCAPGYHPDGDECLIDETCEPTTCNSQGTCDDTTGALICSCATGYTGPNCRQCAPGYHQLEEGGMCFPDEMCAPDACNDHGSCQVVEGVAVCNCFAGYEGPTCADCEAGYHADGGLCVLDEVCSANSCSGVGTCDDSSGAVVCICPTGYTGPNCGQCDVDYTRANGVCTFIPLPNTMCNSNTCNGHGTCDDSSGTAVCTCVSPYTGSRCSSCVAGYVLLDGVCVVSTCGDGIRDGRIGEECDDGTGVQEDCPYGPTGCSVCGGTNPNPVETRGRIQEVSRYQPADYCKVVPGVPHYCGDFVNDGGANETCDDGGTPADCELDTSGQLVDPSCGNLDACLNTCQANTCGDSFVNPGAETCDDGTNDAQYGDEGECASDCHLAPYCGDLLTNGSEECDDGIDVACDDDPLDPECVADNEDECTNACMVNVCGDGIIYNPPSVEEVSSRTAPPRFITAQEGSGPFSGQPCDDGDLNTDVCPYETECLVCFPPGSSPKTPECTYQWGSAPYCGDGVVQPGDEVCEYPGYCYEPPLRGSITGPINNGNGGFGAGGSGAGGFGAGGSGPSPSDCEVCAEGCDATELLPDGYEFCGDGTVNGPEQCTDEDAEDFCEYDCCSAGNVSYCAGLGQCADDGAPFYCSQCCTEG